MNTRIIFVLSALVFVIRIISPTACKSSSTCLEESGAPAIFRSTKCDSAARQGRRKYMEDRTSCTLDIRIPFPDENGIREITVGIVAVFDGQNGAEASEMASKLFFEYFTRNTYFLLDKKGMLPDKVKLEEHVLHIGRINDTLPTIFDGAFHLEILKESLVRTINDIDAEFSKEASRYNDFTSGSTATVVLIADTQILVANVGDSKAFLCSQSFQSPLEAEATLMRLYKKKTQDGVSVRMKYYRNFENGLTHLSTKELTRDHHPDRPEERSRVESAGGHVLEWAGVSRVNGQLAVSRANGDVSYTKFGVISLPEVTNWQPLTSNDSYLVVASDGVFEKQSPQEVCDLIC